MPAARLIASTNFKLPHRVIAAGEVLATVVCDNEADLQFVMQHIRWSSFRFEMVGADEQAINDADVLVVADAPEIAVAPVVDIFDQIAGADVELLAGMNGLGPKGAAKLVENAKAHVAKRDEEAAAAKAAEETASTDDAPPADPPA